MSTRSVKNNSRDIVSNKYMFTEGNVTERVYLKELNSYKSEFRIASNIDIQVIKDEDDTTSWYQNLYKQMAKFVEEKSKKDKYFFKENDEVYILFDLDVIRTNETKINELKSFIKNNNNIKHRNGEMRINYALSNPCFDLFILAHFPIYDNNNTEFIEKVYNNEKEQGKKRRFVDLKISDQIGTNIKNIKVGTFFDKFFRQLLNKYPGMDFNDMFHYKVTEIALNKINTFDDIDDVLNNLTTNFKKFLKTVMS